MPLDFAYAPKIGVAPMTQAGGGGADQIPPPAQVTAYGRDGDASGPPKAFAPQSAALPRDRVAPVVAAVNAAWRKKLDRTLRRYAHKRMAEERAQFSARLDVYLLEQAALTVSQPAPVIVREYSRARLCDGSCDREIRG